MLKKLEILSVLSFKADLYIVMHYQSIELINSKLL